MTRVVSIFERVGVGGGGKTKAVYHRMNGLAERAGFEPILISIDHSPQRKINFVELQAKGVIAPGVRHMTVPEALYDVAVAAGVKVYDRVPAFDRIEQLGSKTSYYLADDVVMVERVKRTVIGAITKRLVTHKDGNQLFTLIDGVLHQMVQKKADGVTETTDYAHGLPIRWLRAKGRVFQLGRNLINGTIYRMERIHGCGFFGMIPWGEAVVFFDGVTSAYLSPVTQARRALFLHADHRGPDGNIVPRSRYLLENFKGEAIITSTAVHKLQLERDVKPAAPIHVIPHFTEAKAVAVAKRQHLVTVSRLELAGKPIDQCIAAFARVMGEFPEVDYLIYGVGAGQKRLQAQIAALRCDKRVRLMGYTTDPLGVFQGAIASVYPTMTEGFGLSILEALSNGCPVISYDVNYGPREMIVPGVAGELVQPGDIDGIAEAMRRVLRAPDRYQAATIVGLERYSRQAYLANYRDFVQGMVAGT